MEEKKKKLDEQEEEELSDDASVVGKGEEAPEETSGKEEKEETSEMLGSGLEERMAALEDKLEQVIGMMERMHTSRTTQQSQRAQQSQQEPSLEDMFFSNPIAAVRRVVTEVAAPWVDGLEEAAIASAYKEMAAAGKEREFRELLPIIRQSLRGSVDPRYRMRPETWTGAFKMLQALRTPEPAKKSVGGVEAPGVPEGGEETIQLTPEERRYARKFGMSDKEWAAYKGATQPIEKGGK